MKYTVIPGLPEGENPESSGISRPRTWIPGSATRPRNDELSMGANQEKTIISAHGSPFAFLHADRLLFKLSPIVTNSRQPHALAIVKNLH
jgi:hypothetical protein